MCRNTHRLAKARLLQHTAHALKTRHRSSCASTIKPALQASITCCFSCLTLPSDIPAYEAFYKDLHSSVPINWYSKQSQPHYTQQPVEKIADYRYFFIYRPPKSTIMSPYPWSNDEEYFRRYTHQQTFRYMGQQNFPRGPLPRIRELCLPDLWREGQPQNLSQSCRSGNPKGSEGVRKWSATRTRMVPEPPPK
ncbi:hypothetical protein IG631_23388 [Alternaria alternata]|nr:hypothetical protein IG631_23388 [Alternaria alternata]